MKMSFSFAKLKSFLPGQNSSAGNSSDKRHSLSLEPEIGFQLILEQSVSDTGTASSGSKCKNENNGPSLNVHLISARHLPSVFGFKTVQGYQIKVKLFPGSKRYDSTIQTCTWPKFDESFKFALEPDIKPSIKNYAKEKNPDNLLEKLCSGQFVVFTVYALLELPPATFNRFKGTYRSLREKGNSLLKGNKAEANNQNNQKSKEAKDKQDNVTTQNQLTQSESRRNIGSVTCFLDSKIFKENPKTGRYVTDEMWLPIKDITITPSKLSSASNSTKGQIELVLEICDSIKEEQSTNESDQSTTSKGNDVNKKNEKSSSQPAVLKKQWSINEMKKKLKGGKASKDNKQLYLKVTTSKMRCSIKVKDDFENSAGEIYVKTAIFEHDILSNSWKCENFLPSLSTRWDPENSTVVVPINNEENLKNISIRTTVATKTKVGKKIILGTVMIGSKTSGSGLEHWNTVIATRNEPITKWHNFQ